jgi:hypothetical protein
LAGVEVVVWGCAFVVEWDVPGELDVVVGAGMDGLAAVVGVGAGVAAGVVVDEAGVVGAGAGAGGGGGGGAGAGTAATFAAGSWIAVDPRSAVTPNAAAATTRTANAASDSTATPRRTGRGSRRVRAVAPHSTQIC